MCEEQQTLGEREEIARLREKYKHIVAWGRFMGSYDYYIESQPLKAERDNAPEDAIYKEQEIDVLLKGEWVTYGKVTNPRSRNIMDKSLEEQRVKP